MAKITFGLLLLAISNCYAAFVRFNPTVVNANLKLPINLKCQSDEVIDIFYKDKKIEQNSKYTLTRRAGIDLQLAIQSVELADIGKYTCKSSTSSRLSDLTLQLNPYFLDDKKVYNKELSKKAVVEFTILGSPRPDIKYSRKKTDGTYEDVAEITDFGLMVVGKDAYSINQTNGHLTINNVEAKHGGDYRVQTTFQGNYLFGTFKLNVGVKPAIVAPPPPSYDLVSGESAEIQCVFSAMPATVKWEISTKDNKKVEVTGTTGIFGLDQTNLTISSVSPAHEGANLTCSGTNAFGSASARTKITMVYVKPVITALSNADVVEGSEKNLKCVASGNPVPKVTWKKVGSAVELTQDQSKAGESVYKIASASVADAGTYKCAAVISAKPSLKDEATMAISVLTKPVILDAESTKSVTFAVGKSETKDVKCVATGIPVPTIKITKGNSTLTGTDTISGNKITSVLKFSANAPSDAGVITCTANNSVGAASYEIKITLIEKPVAPTGLMASNIEKTSVVLKWGRVAGATKYSIKQNDKVVASSQMTEFMIKNLEGGKTYKFAVAAENAAGLGAYTSVKEVTTQKYDKPSAPKVAKMPSLKDPVISWEKPKFGGNDPALQYTVEICTGGKCDLIYTNKTSVSLKLKKKADYSISVTAKNSRGAISTQTFKFRTDAGAPPTTKPGPTDKVIPKPPAKAGLSGGAIAGIIIAVILILLIVIDLFCCFFNDCGFSHCCYQTCCAEKSKEGYSAAETKDVEKAELKEVGNDHENETKTVPEEKEDAAKEKKSEDV